MKITKGQLKRIIAEEHQVVFGKKPASRKRTRRLTAKQRRIVEAKKKQAHTDTEAVHKGTGIVRYASNACRSASSCFALFSDRVRVSSSSRSEQEGSTSAAWTGAINGLIR